MASDLIISDRQLPQANSDSNSFLLINKYEPVLTGNVYNHLCKKKVQW